MRLVNKYGYSEANSIVIQTSKGRDISNFQEKALSEKEKRESSCYLKKYRQAKIRTNATAFYNCFGMTFGSRRARIWKDEDIANIIEDDNYQEIGNIKDILPGDLILYIAENGSVDHSGIVISEPESPLFIPMIVSKWGNFGEVIHAANYGPYAKLRKRYYRITR